MNNLSKKKPTGIRMQQINAYKKQQQTVKKNKQISTQIESECGTKVARAELNWARTTVRMRN